MSHHILCVDELGLTRVELSEMLKKFDVKVSSVKNEVEVLNYLHDSKKKVDALVWSISSIDFKDFESIKAIKSRAAYKHLPVVIVSKFTDRKYVIKAIEAGAGEYIVKPYDELMATKKLCSILGISFDGNKPLNQEEDLVMFNFNEMFTREVKCASRGKHSLAIMMASVIPKNLSELQTDNSNEIVDLISKVIKLKLRDTDTVFFYGEGNLIILLPFADINGTLAVENKMRNAFETHTLIKKKKADYQLVISTVSFPEDGKVKEKLLEKLESNFKEAIRTCYMPAEK